MGRQRSIIGLRYAAQPTPLTAPTTGWKGLRFTGESIKTDTQVVRSNEIVGSRESSGALRVGQTGGGGINLEWHYETFDDFLDFALGGGWVSDVLTVGPDPSLFAVEKAWGDLATPKFDLYTDCQMTGFTIEATLGGIITGGFTFVSKGGVIGTAKAASGSVAAVNANPIWTSTDWIRAIAEGGAPISGITSFKLQAQIASRTQGELGTPDVTGTAAGEFVLTGSLTQYLSDTALVAKARAFTDSSLSVELGGVSAKKYVIDIPAINYQTDSELAGGKGQDVFVETPWEAKGPGTLTITRTA
jgi:hypothetical protein